MRIVGVDPGTHRIGFALLDGSGRDPELMSAETITFPTGGDATERRRNLADAFAGRLAVTRADGVAVEKLFFAKNTKTALAVAEARGIILLTAERHVRSIWEYTPLEVKLAVTGYGRADKEQVRRMIHLAFPHVTLPTGDDAIDAIAIALTAYYRERTRWTPG